MPTTYSWRRANVASRRRELGPYFTFSRPVCSDKAMMLEKTKADFDRTEPTFFFVNNRFWKCCFYENLYDRSGERDNSTSKRRKFRHLLILLSCSPERSDKFSQEQHFPNLCSRYETLVQVRSKSDLFSRALWLCLSTPAEKNAKYRPCSRHRLATFARRQEKVVDMSLCTRLDVYIELSHGHVHPDMPKLRGSLAQLTMDTI